MPMVADEAPARGRRRSWLTLGLGVLTLGAALALAGVGYVHWANTLPPREPDPRPALAADGFQPCMEVARSLKSIPIWGSEEQWLAVHVAAVRQMSPAERAALEKLRSVARMEIRIPKDGDGQDPAFDPLNNALRRVIAASKVALAEGDRTAAADRALIGLELGSRLGRGGFLCYGVVSSAIARVTVARLEPCLDGLSAQEARAAGERVDAVLARLPSHADILREQRRYDLARFAQRLRTSGPDLLPHGSMPGYLNQPWLRPFLWSVYPKPSSYAAADEYYRAYIAEAKKPFPWCRSVPWPEEPLARAWVAPVAGRIVRLLAAEATIRLLRLELALEEYRKTHGRYPERLQALAPELLPSLPNDPFTEKPFRYRLAGKRYLLYSVGPDRQDNRGTPIPQGGFPVVPGDLVAGKTSLSLPQQ